MAEKMAERIAEILKGPNFQTAKKALTDFCGTMDGEFRNLLVDIIVKRWIDTPKDVPFSYARSIWNRSWKISLPMEDVSGTGTDCKSGAFPVS